MKPSENRWAEVSRRHFRQVAAKYDVGRTFEKGEYWAEQILRRTPLDSKQWLLDLGCGTGVFSGALSENLPCAVVGLDLSAAMLATARVKTETRRVHWVQGSGEALPLATGSAGAVFLSQVWHHLQDERTVAAEILRVLRTGGGLFIKTFSHQQIRQRWDLTAIFPELLPFMTRIYPDLGDFELMLKRVGFSRVDFSTCRSADSLHPSELRRIAEARLWSMFSYISDGGLAQGLDRLSQAIETTRDAPVTFDETLVWAVK